jgi:hypothetical protein
MKHLKELHLNEKFSDRVTHMTIEKFFRSFSLLPDLTKLYLSFCLPFIVSVSAHNNFGEELCLSLEKLKKLAYLSIDFSKHDEDVLSLLIKSFVSLNTSPP